MPNLMGPGMGGMLNPRKHGIEDNHATNTKRRCAEQYDSSATPYFHRQKPTLRPSTLVRYESEPGYRYDVDDKPMYMNFQAIERLIRDTFELASNQVVKEAKTAFATNTSGEEGFLEVKAVKGVLVPLLARDVSTIVHLVDDEEIDREGPARVVGTAAAPVDLTAEDDHMACTAVTRVDQKPLRSVPSWRGDGFAKGGETSHRSSYPEFKSRFPEHSEESDDAEDAEDATDDEGNDDTFEAKKRKTTAAPRRVETSKVVDTKKRYVNKVHRPLFNPTGVVFVQRAFNIAARGAPSPELTLQFEMPHKKKTVGGSNSLVALAEEVARFLSYGPGSDYFIHASFHNGSIWLAHYSTIESADAANGRRMIVGNGGEFIEMQPFRESPAEKPYTGAKTYLCTNVPHNTKPSTIALELLARFPESTMRFTAEKITDGPMRSRSCMTMEFEFKTDIRSLHYQLPGCNAIFNDYIADKQKNKACWVCKDKGHRFDQCPRMQVIKLKHPRALGR